MKFIQLNKEWSFAVLLQTMHYGKKLLKGLQKKKSESRVP
jgi:hypothetical protein